MHTLCQRSRPPPAAATSRASPGVLEAVQVTRRALWHLTTARAPLRRRAHTVLYDCRQRPPSVQSARHRQPNFAPKAEARGCEARAWVNSSFLRDSCNILNNSGMKCSY